MAETDSEQWIEIAAPPQEVFEWIIDEEKSRQWYEFPYLGIPREELRTGYVDSAVDAGEQKSHDLTTRILGDEEVEVTAFDPPRELAVRNRGRWLDVTRRFLLKESKGGTLLRAYEKRTWKNAVGLLMEFPVLVGLGDHWHRKGHRGDLEKLKMLAEAAASRTTPEPGAVDQTARSADALRVSNVQEGTDAR